MKRLSFISSLWAYFVFGLVLATPGSLNADEPFHDLVAKYQGFDLDQDGTAEINRLEVMPFKSKSGREAQHKEPASADRPIVLVLVEQRLLADLSESRLGVPDLRLAIDTFGQDLEREGWSARLLICDFYSGPIHQDGLTLLAVRRFLQEFRNQQPLQGVVLVGSFPEASLVRRWIWRREGWDVTIAGQAYHGANQKPFLRIVPESIAPRADIVLADLDGNWESIYRRGPERLESIEAFPAEAEKPWPTDAMEFRSTQFNDQTSEFQDFFWIQDDRFERLATAEKELRLKLFMDQVHPEIAAADREQPNPMARPEILVSRINPRHVAVMPDKAFRDIHDRNWLDASGQPQIVETRERVQPASYLRRDPVFERRLLLEYFARNHTFRTESLPAQLRTAAASFGGGLISATDLNGYLRKALVDGGESVAFDNATLLNLMELAVTPARLKGISAHSSPWNSEFGSGYDVQALESAVGGRPWRWREEKTETGYRYVPSLAGQGGTADAYMFRSLYESGRLKSVGGSLLIHNGCEVNTPEGALRFPYSDPNYGSPGGFQNAESILFFLNGVALASRSKTFYDTPRGFPEALGNGGTFGEGWRAYFTTESQDASLPSSIASNKRTYPWSVIGDWTLKVR